MYMHEDIPFDRNIPCEDIISIINSSQKTMVLIMFADTGIGKSSVSKKVMFQIPEKYKHNAIRVKTLPDTKNKNTAQGMYVLEIFNAVRQYYNREFKKNKHNRDVKKLTFSYYIRHNKNKQIKKRVIYSMLEKGSNINENYKFNFSKLILYYLGMRILSVGEYDPTRYCNDNLENISIAYDYIKYILAHGDVFLNIDNIQNIDDYSLKCLVNCLIESELKNNFFLLEYTTINHKLDNMLILKEVLSNTNALVKTYHLPPLDTKDAIFLAQNYFIEGAQISNEKLESYYNNHSNGNLRKLEDFTLSNNIQVMDNDNQYDPTNELLLSLDNNSKFIIAIVSWHNGKMTKLLLKDIILTSNHMIIDSETIIEGLEKKYNIVKIDDTFIEITHSSILDSWRVKLEGNKLYDLLAYRACEQYYTSLLKNNVFYTTTKEQCISYLFQLYTSKEPIKIFDIIKYLEEVVIDFISIDQAWEYLKNLMDSIDKPASFVDVYYYILKICCSLELYKEAEYCLNVLSKIENEKKTEKYAFYNCLILGQLERYEDAIVYADSIINQNNSNTLKVYMYLLQIAYYCSLNNRKEANKLVNLINSCDEFTKCVQFGYLMRLAEAYDTRDRAISLVMQSVEFFEKHGNEEQAAKSRVSLSFLYAITGKLDFAYQEIIKAEKVLLSNIKNLHVFSVNKACLYLLMDRFGSEIWDMLEKAELTARLLFNKIAILINKIIWCIENEEIAMGHYLEQSILRLLEFESDKHLHAIANYNLYVFNERISNPHKAQEYYHRAYELRDHCVTLKCRMENKSEAPDNTTFLLSKPWHVCFVSYMNLDYLNDL